MAIFSTKINLGTVSAAITNVKLYECTGNNTGCVELTNYTNVPKASFDDPNYIVTGITDTMNYIKVEALGTCAGTIQSLLITGKPGTATPTPTPTATVGPTSTPTPTPTVTVTPTPTATTTSQTMVWNLSRCSDGGDASQVIAYNSNYDPGIVIKGSNGICYTIEVTGYSSQPLITVITEFDSDCADCTDGLPSEPDPITFSVTPSCVGYAPTGVTITINNASGGSGTGYYVKMTSPSGNDTPHNLPYAYSGLNNYVGNTYAFTVYDSEDTPSNNVALTEDYSCAAAPNNTVMAKFHQGSTAPNSTACTNASEYQFTMNSPSATFCDATSFITTSNTLRDLGTGYSFWLCYDGKTRQLFHTSNSYTFAQAGQCQDIIVGF
jgi:hypothetical protein